MSKYIDIHQRVRSLLKGGTGTYPDLIILDGINAATNAILPWLSKRAIEKGVVVTSGSLIDLPDDVYLVDAVYSVTDEKWLRHWVINPTLGTFPSDPMWIEYPNGYLTLSIDCTDEVMDVYYYTTWTEVDTSGSASDNMDTPPFADLAIIYYATAYVLASSAVSAAQLRQFNTKIDSGSPDDNPLRDTSNMLMQRFINEVKLFPSLERAQK